MPGSISITREYVLSVGNVPVPRSGEIRINCPYCDDTKFHMYVNLSKGLYNCFKCGSNGKLDNEFIPRLEDYHAALKYGVTEIKKAIVRNLPLCSPVSACNSIVLNNYLLTRGITIGDIERYNIRVSSDSYGPYRGTVIFPIYEQEQLKYFVCRRYTNEQPKYVNAPWPKEDTLFIASPYDNKVYRDIDVIVEGVFDAIAVSKMGYRGVAILGKTLNSQQILRLMKNNAPKIIFLDRDAFTHAIGMKMQLATLGLRTELIVNPGKDAADLYMSDRNTLKEMLDAARDRLNTKS